MKLTAEAFGGLLWGIGAEFGGQPMGNRAKVVTPENIA